MSRWVAKSIRAFLKSRNEGKGLERMGIEKASGMREVGEFCFGEYQANDEIVEASHDTSGLGFGHPSVVFA